MKKHNPKKSSKSKIPAAIRAELDLLREQINSLKENVRPFILERDAILESRDRLLISCDASWTDKAAAVAFIMRSITFKDPYKVSCPTRANSSNVAELDALYMALDNLSSMHLHTLKDKRVKYVEIRSDSQLCINWITGKKNCHIESIRNKVLVIKDLVKGLEALSGKEIKFSWRKRNSTFDLIEANYLAQTKINVKVH
jgi:ribonuclease HI